MPPREDNHRRKAACLWLCSPAASAGLQLPACSACALTFNALGWLWLSFHEPAKLLVKCCWGAVTQREWNMGTQSNNDPSCTAPNHWRKLHLALAILHLEDAQGELQRKISAVKQRGTDYRQCPKVTNSTAWKGNKQFNVFSFQTVLSPAEKLRKINHYL